MKKIFSFLILTLVLTGCEEQVDDSDKLKVITSYYPYELVTSEIGGDFVDVSSVYPIDSDAHSYELTPKQSIELEEADLVILTNEEEDNKIYSSIQNNENILMVDNLDENHEQSEDEHHQESEHHAHSHSWLSPKQMTTTINLIATQLTSLDTANADSYEENATALQQELTSVDEAYSQFAKAQTKSIVSTHDAYSALTNDYEIEFITLYGQHHDDEPTTKEIIEVVDLINSTNIETIFVEQNDTANSVMHQIADETGTSIETLFTLESQSSVREFDSIIDFYNYNLEMLEMSQN